MADKQNRWLDRETTERLLRGESPDNAVAPDVRDQAERLVRTLSALSGLSGLSAPGGTPPSDAPGELAGELAGELPGEAAALTAFREARAERDARAVREAWATDASVPQVPRVVRTAGGAIPEARVAPEGQRVAREEKITAEAVAALGRPGGSVSPGGSGGSGGSSTQGGSGAVGEVAALAAFRQARAVGGAEAGAVRVAHTADAGLVRIGGRGSESDLDDEATTGRDLGRRPRRSRPLRLGLAAALAIGMVGGVAAAAGTGLLKGPFGGTEPGSRSSVSAAASERPPASPAPDASGGTPDTVMPDGGAEETDGADRGATGDPKGDPKGDDSAADPGAGRTWPNGVTSSCRDLRDGRQLDSGPRRTLEGLAGGPSHVPAYCADVLGGTSGKSPDTGGDRDGDGKGGEDGKGGTGKSGRGGQDDHGSTSGGQNDVSVGTGPSRVGESGKSRKSGRSGKSGKSGKGGSGGGRGGHGSGSGGHR